MSIGGFGITPFFQIPDLETLGQEYEVTTNNNVAGDKKSIFNFQIPNIETRVLAEARIVATNAGGNAYASFKRTAMITRGGSETSIILQNNDFDTSNQLDFLNAYFEGSNSDFFDLFVEVQPQFGVEVLWKAFVKILDVDGNNL